MLALPCKQPYGHAIIYLGKGIDNRTYPDYYRGALLIHASKKCDRQYWEEAAATFEQAGVNLPKPDDVYFGGLIGVVDKVDCYWWEYGRNGWGFDSHYHWILENARPFKKPVPCVGRMRPFEVDLTLEEIEALVKGEIQVSLIGTKRVSQQLELFDLASV